MEDLKRNRDADVGVSAIAKPSTSAASANVNVSEAEQNVINRPYPLHKFVLTGGPCGGKTTALARVSTYLRERGFEVMTCPEAFSIYVSNGMSLDYLGAVKGMSAVVQGSVIDLQVALEDGFERVLRARGRPAVLLCDRGICDSAAYLSPEDWESVLRLRGVTETEVREGRYNAIFHLVTAAEGAEEYYTLENNEARSETPEQARQVDLNTQKAWVGHPKLYVIDNSTDFEGKLQRLVDTTAKLVGLPSSLPRDTRKYLLKAPPKMEDLPPDVKAFMFDVEKVYLYDEVETEEKKIDEKDGKRESNPNYTEEYSFVRKRSALRADGSVSGTVYGQTTVKRTRDGQVIELKRIISGREYTSALRTRDPSRHIVRQRRISFLWKMQSFTVHIYQEPVSDLCILHAQVECVGAKDNAVSAGGKCDGPGEFRQAEIPPFLEVVRPIDETKEDEESYGAFNISLMSS